MATLATDLAHHNGIMTDPGNFERFRIDAVEHVKIDEGIVHRGDQRVGHRVRKSAEIIVRTRRVDDDKIMSVLNFADGPLKGGEVLALSFNRAVYSSQVKPEVIEQFQLYHWFETNFYGSEHNESAISGEYPDQLTLL